MKVLLVAATRKEVGGIQQKLRIHKEISNSFNKYVYGTLKVDILITGSGNVLMTYNLTKILSYNHYDLVLNVGIAETLDHFMELGFVVNVIKDTFGDIGIYDNDKFYTLCEKELMNEKEIFDDCWMINETNLKIPEIESMIGVRGVTLNSLSGNKTMLQNLQKKFNPEILTLEGASFFYCCKKENIPFFQIRAISKYTEIRNIDNWSFSEAITNLTESVLTIFDEFELL